MNQEYLNVQFNKLNKNVKKIVCKSNLLTRNIIKLRRWGYP